MKTLLLIILSSLAAVAHAEWVLYNTETGEQITISDNIEITLVTPQDPDWATAAQDENGNCIGNGSAETTQSVAEVGRDENGRVNDSNHCTRVGPGDNGGNQAEISRIAGIE